MTKKELSVGELSRRPFREIQRKIVGDATSSAYVAEKKHLFTGQRVRWGR